MATTSSVIISHPSSPHASYTLTILSIFRNSLPYLRRYLDQVESLAVALPQATIMLQWLEGDSTDGTLDALANYAAILNESSSRVHVRLVKYDVGGQLWPSIDHPVRWAQLAQVWNENLYRTWPQTEYAICVESDLIWSSKAAVDSLRHVKQRIADVVYPLLMYTKSQFYDTHATYRQGKQFSAWAPFVPDGTGYRGERFVDVDHAGGLIAMRGETLQLAAWDSADCVLKFPPHIRCRLDMATLIQHPQR
jgi:hypothetical protein